VKSAFRTPGRKPIPKLPKPKEKLKKIQRNANGNGNGARAAVRPEPAVARTLKSAPASTTGFRLEPKLLVQIHDLMVKARVLEERLIRMYKQSDGYFWIGGPGEEAFNVPLGLQIKKGHGLDHDFLHLHYRSGAILTAMGMDPVDPIRQMKNVAADPF